MSFREWTLKNLRLVATKGSRRCRRKADTWVKERQAAKILLNAVDTTYVGFRHKIG